MIKSITIIIKFLFIFFIFSTVIAGNKTGYKGSDSSCTKINYPLPGTLTTLTLTLQDHTYWGYISGNNLSRDKVKANYFSYDTIHTYIKGAFFEFGAASNTSGQNPEITIGLWKFTDSKLDTVMVTGVNLAISKIVDDVNNHRETYIEFTTPVQITGDYLIGVKLPVKKGDTIALKSNTNGDTKPGTAWERWSDGTWHQYSEPDCWFINISNAIYPLTCSKPDGIEENKVQTSNLETEIYPNPARDILKLKFNNPDLKNVSVKIFDLTGTCLKSNDLINGTSSEYNLNISKLEPGIYFLKISSWKLISIKKFIIIK